MGWAEFHRADTGSRFCVAPEEVARFNDNGVRYPTTLLFKDGSSETVIESYDIVSKRLHEAAQSRPEAVA